MIINILLINTFPCTGLCNKERLSLNFIDKLTLCDLNRKQAIHCHNQCTIILGIKNVPYNGKYAYKQVYGINEIFSFVLSLLSTLILFYYYIQSPKTIMNYLRLIFGCLAYLASAFFHIRETPFTKLLDYTAAQVYLHFSVLHRLSIALQLYQNRRNIKIMIKQVFTFSYVVALGYTYIHIRNFGCDMIKRVSIFPTFAGFICMLINRHICQFKGACGSIITLCIGFAIEQLQLPPYKYLIDSHAIWHLFLCIGEIYTGKYLLSEYRYLIIKEQIKDD